MPKFLIINDNKLVCVIIGQLIRNLNKDIKIAIKLNGQSALKYLYQIVEDHTFKVPDVILLDINMNVLDGAGFLKEMCKIKSYFKNTSVYIVTATIEDHINELAEKYSCIKGVYELPLTPAQLSEIYYNSIKDQSFKMAMD